MQSEYDSDPLQNSPFENSIILTWFLENCSGFTGELDVEHIITIGFGPFEENELVEVLELSPYIDYLELWYADDPFPSGLDDIIVVGREGWSADVLDQQIQYRQGGTCKIYSQEMLIAYAITGSDPFDA